MIDLQALQALVDVTKLGSFHQAAQANHCTQSTISYQIKKLERQFDCQLFDRSHYRAKLTHRGQQVYLQAQQLLQQVQQFERSVQQSKTEWEPKLNIIVEGSFPIAKLLNALKVLQKHEFPTQLSISVDYLSRVNQRFEQEDFDMMLTTQLSQQQNLIHHLPDIIFRLVAAPDHPLTQEPTVTVHDLQHYTELTVYQPKTSQDPANPYSFKCQKVFALNDFYSKRQALLLGLGFGWLPEFMIDDDLNENRLQTIPLHSGNRYHYTPYLVHKPLAKTGLLLKELLMNI